jgi:YVTN family beta-propeller protein
MRPQFIAFRVPGFAIAPCIVASLTAAAVAASTGAMAAEFTLRASYQIAGDGGWDYLSYDTASNRLFIARASRVRVVNPDSGAITGEIADTPAVHGVALAGDLGKGYPSNGRDDSVTVFDLRTLATLSKVRTPAAAHPDFIIYDASTRRILAFNARSHDASVIDAVTEKLDATIALGGKPEAAVADGRGRVLVDLENKNDIAEIDTLAATVVAIRPLAGCREPVRLAMDVRTRRLFVGCHNPSMLVVNADTGAVVASLPIGDVVDATAFDAKTGQVFGSQGDGTLSVVNEETADPFRLEQTVLTRRGARTMALKPVNHDVYLVTADIDETPAASRPRHPTRTMHPGSFTLLAFSQRR